MKAQGAHIMRRMWRLAALASLGLAASWGCEENAGDGPGSQGTPSWSAAGSSSASATASASGAGTGGAGTGGAGGAPGTGGAGGDDCFMNPKTHYEIINACTDAESVDKKEQVGIWDEGQTLPPLP